MPAKLPFVSWGGLDELWFQVAGTVCNLSCTHCFISCSPHNHNFEFLAFSDIEHWLTESQKWGVREFYYTGGEPFLNRDLVPMLVRTLDFGPATVLTNATVLKPDWLQTLRAAEEASRYSLEFRVSIDAPDASGNDPIRGEGAFDRAMAGVKMLVLHGFLPIITMTRLWDEADDDPVLGAFQQTLRNLGYTRPRLKILPRLRLGAEARRSAGYAPREILTAEMLAGFDVTQLICQHSRVVTSRGIHVCPILLDSPSSYLGNTLEAAAVPFALTHGACTTCYHYGAICTNPSVKRVPG